MKNQKFNNFEEMQHTQVIIDEDLDLFGADVEKGLLTALLFDGLQTFLANGKEDLTELEKIKVRGAKDWVVERDYEYSYSFENVCSALGICSDNLRLGLINIANTN